MMEQRIKPTDRRIRRTLRLLQNALLELIEEKAFETITVEEIVARADVGRTTFYLHYTDKGHLLADCVTFMAQDSRLQDAPVLKFFQDAQKSQSLYQTVLSGKGGLEALQRLHDDVSLLAKEVFETQIRQHNLEPLIAPDFMAHHFAGALLALAHWWLLEGMARYTAEEMTAQFHKLTVLGRGYGMGVEAGDVEVLRSLGNMADYVKE
ncbi:MAG: helix-turn-helix domain-containing protein [Chloroflexota bacterium]